MPIDNNNNRGGQEKLKGLAPLYYRQAHGAIVVYDITDSTSFERAKYWVKELKRQHEACSKNVSIALAGNKVDLEERRKVQTEVARTYAKTEGLIFMETSAKTGDNISEIFTALVQHVQEQASKVKEEESQQGRQNVVTAVDGVVGERMKWFRPWEQTRRMVNLFVKTWVSTKKAVLYAFGYWKVKY